MVINKRSQNNLQDKKILITAGPTWVAIDRVRVISNIASGETGILLAERLNAIGAKVTLILGPAGPCHSDKKIKVIRFRFFDELRQRIRKELKSQSYDFIIHSAAVSDFKPQTTVKGKLGSDRIHNLKLTALPKIVNDIKRLAPLARLVLFKLEVGVSDQKLINRARQALGCGLRDLAVANTIEPHYKAYLIDKNRIYSKAGSREELAGQLIAVLS